MTVKSKKQFDKSKGLMIIAIGILLLTLTYILATYPRGTTEQHASTSRTGAHVSLGALEYDFSSGKAVKRIDKNISELKSFLTTRAEQEISPNCDTVYYNVVATSSKEEQVLLHYGCGYPNAGMFAVKKDGAWKFISPTNQFDTFGIPACSHVNENDIEATIAPVCGNESTTSGYSISYQTRI
jgi:hypothetical protein